MRWFSKKKTAKRSFSTSPDYWENRYRSGRNSGAGSYGRLADFKAEVINDFVATESIQSVVEWGCGDGNQLALARYPHYTGLDVSAAAIELCSDLFRHDNSKRFLHIASSGQQVESVTADLALSLDVIYHLVEDEVFERYMRSLFLSANRYVIIYSSNQCTDSGQPHVRHRLFTDWLEANEPAWVCSQKIDNCFGFSEQDSEQTSFSDFYIFKKIIA